MRISHSFEGGVGFLRGGSGLLCQQRGGGIPKSPGSPSKLDGMAGAARKFPRVDAQEHGRGNENAKLAENLRQRYLVADLNSTDENGNCRGVQEYFTSVGELSEFPRPTGPTLQDGSRGQAFRRPWILRGTDTEPLRSGRWAAETRLPFRDLLVAQRTATALPVLFADQRC